MARKKKRTKNKKTPVKSKKEKRLALPDKTKKFISGALMFLAAVLIGFSFFEKDGRNLAGAAGELFMKGAQWLIGSAVFFIPLIFILGGLVFLNTKYKKYSTPSGLAIILLIIGLTGLLGATSGDQQTGGKLGFILSYPLLRIFDFWATVIIFITIIIIGGIIVWHFMSFERRKKEEAELEGEKDKGIEGEGPAKTSLVKKIFAPKFQVKEIEPVPPAPHAFPEAQPQTSSLEIKTQTIGGGAGALRSFVKDKDYQHPPLNLFESDKGSPTIGDIKISSTIIKRTLENFDIQVEMSGVHIGPTVTQYTLKPAEGIKLSKITGLSNNLAMALAAHPLRIEAPIPGKSLVGIEIPNQGRTWVRLRNLLENTLFQNSLSCLSLPLGRDVAANPVFADLAKMPHMLVAGSTGTGKTIGLNSIILSLLFQNSPETLRLILVDPKRVEFPIFNGLPHLLTPVIVTADKTVNMLKWLIEEMERRFDILAAVKARDINSYNEIMAKQEEVIMPYIVLIIDELADLMAARGKEIEATVARLAQMARAVGIHLIVATQRPSVEVITGLIKANITSRIAFQVASQVDSRTILDTSGAEKLLGAGDMLFISADTSKPKRIQGVYVSDKEVKKVIHFIKGQNKEQKGDEEPGDGLQTSIQESLEKKAPSDVGYDGGEDPLYDEAKRVVTEAGKASASLLQRRLRVGYARAARLIDMLENGGVVGPADGAKPREVYTEEDKQAFPEEAEE